VLCGGRLGVGAPSRPSIKLTNVVDNEKTSSSKAYCSSGTLHA